MYIYMCVCVFVCIRVDCGVWKEMQWMELLRIEIIGWEGETWEKKTSAWAFNIYILYISRSYIYIFDIYIKWREGKRERQARQRETNRKKERESKILKKNQNIIALQCCVGFCLTTSWISHMYTYILSLLSLPPTPSHPSRSSQSSELSSLCYTQLPTSYLFHIW